MTPIPTDPDTRLQRKEAAAAQSAAEDHALVPTAWRPVTTGVCVMRPNRNNRDNRRLIVAALNLLAALMRLFDHHGLPW
jgi:hypothetical protein